MMLKARSTIHLKIMLFESVDRCSARFVSMGDSEMVLSLPVSGGSGAETAGGEAEHEARGPPEGSGGEQQLQQDGRGEADPEDGTNQGKP